MRLPAPLGRPDLQRHSKEAVWVVSGCLLEISGPHLGSFPAPCLGIFKKPAHLCGGRPILGRLGCLLAPLGRPDPQRHSKEAVWVVSGCLLEISGPHLGGLPAPTGTPKSLQGRGQYEASDLKLTQTQASELKWHSFFPQGHRRGELAKRKQFLQSRRPYTAIVDIVPTGRQLIQYLR